MSFFTQIFAASEEVAGSVAIDRSGSVLSATGLSRRALAELFRQNGLFGAESELAPIEQAVVQSRLGWIPGLPARPVLAPTDARLVALETFTESVARAGGIATREQQAQLEAAGFTAAQVGEVVRVVRIVRDVFGLSVAAPRVESRTAARVPTLARAA